mgnify:CR=1 FL=1
MHDPIAELCSRHGCSLAEVFEQCLKDVPDGYSVSHSTVIYRWIETYRHHAFNGLPSLVQVWAEKKVLTKDPNQLELFGDNGNTIVPTS